MGVKGGRRAPGAGGDPAATSERQAARWAALSASVAVGAVAVVDLLVEPSPGGLLAIGPCLASVAAGPRAVVAVGGWSAALAVTVSVATGATASSTLVLLVALAALTVLGARSARVRDRTRAASADRERTTRVLAAVVEDCEDPVVAVDLGGRVTTYNRGAERLFGWTAQEVVGRLARDLVPPARASRLSAFLDDVSAGGSAGASRTLGAFEASVPRRDGTACEVSIVISTIRDCSGAVVGASMIARDIRQSESRRRDLEDRVRQFERAESLGALAGGIAHDFNNLMAVVSAAADFLDGAVADDPRARADVRAITTAAEQATRLTGQLLAYSRGRTADTAALDVGASVRSVASMLARVVGGGIELVVTDGDGDLWTRAAPSRVEQVVVNLTTNARDAMPGGGLLTIDTRAVRVASSPVGVQPPLTPGGYVQLRVSDTGTGMTPETAARAFESFFTTKSAGHGSGLGLSTVHAIVTELGGGLALRSLVGSGTSVTVWFPRVAAPVGHPGPTATAPQPTGRAPGGAGAPTRGGGRLVLLAEDDPQLRVLVVRVLERAGFRVDAGADAGEVLRAADALAPGVVPDLLVSDLLLPGPAGPRLADALTSRFPGLPVLFTSGHSDAAAAGPGTEGTVTDLLTKPFTAEELLTRVDAALRRRHAEIRL